MIDKLMDHLINMREEEAIDTARAFVEAGGDPVQVLDCCMKAMEEVGKRFEKGQYYLPELMMAGEMLQQISEMIKPRMKGERTTRKRGRVLMGTVEGDIHDIGKDIVTFLLDVNGFEVHDIGIDVPPARFVEEIKKFKPQVVGMSGLLTLAFDSMKRTVEAIEEAGLRKDLKIMIGGGVVSDNTRAYCGADAFGKDAMEGVTLAKKWIG